MRTNVTLLKRVFKLVSIFTLFLTITTTNLKAASVNYTPSNTIYYGVETMTLSEKELRDAATANGGWAAVTLRYYLALPPGSFNQIGFPSPNADIHLYSGSTYSFGLVNPDDTAGVIFASNGTFVDPRQKGLKQPDDRTFTSSSDYEKIFYTFGGRVMAQTCNGDGIAFPTKGGYADKLSVSSPGTTSSANNTGTYFKGNGTTEYDTIWIRRLTFVIHDVEAFIAQGGFQVIAENSRKTTEAPCGTDQCLRSLYTTFLMMTNGTGADVNIKCQGNQAASNDWFHQNNCGDYIQLTPGGVTVESKPAIDIYNDWRPCPTYTTGASHGGRATLASVTSDKGSSYQYDIQWWHKRGTAMNNTLAGAPLKNVPQADGGYQDGTGSDTNYLELTQSQVLDLKTDDTIVLYYRYSKDGGTTWDTTISKTHITASTLAPLVRGTYGTDVIPASGSVFYLNPINGVTTGSGDVMQSYTATGAMPQAATSSQYFVALSASQPIAGSAWNDNIGTLCNPDFYGGMGENILSAGNYWKFKDFGATKWVVAEREDGQTNLIRSNTQPALTADSINRWYAFEGIYKTSGLPTNLHGMEGCVILSDTVVVKPVVHPLPPVVNISWGCGDMSELKIVATAPAMTDGSVPPVKDWKFVLRQEAASVLPNKPDEYNISTVAAFDMSLNLTNAANYILFHTTNVNPSITNSSKGGTIATFSVQKNPKSDFTIDNIFNTKSNIGASNFIGGATSGNFLISATANKVLYCGYILDDTTVWTATVNFPARAAGLPAEVLTAASVPVLPNLAVVNRLNANGKPDITLDTAVVLGATAQLNFYMYPNPPATVPNNTDYGYIFQKTYLDPATHGNDDSIWVAVRTGNVATLIWNGTVNSNYTTEQITQTTWYRAVVKSNNCVLGKSTPRKVSLKQAGSAGNITGKRKEGTEELTLTNYNATCYDVANNSTLVLRHSDYASLLAGGDVKDENIIWQDSIPGAGGHGWQTLAHTYDSVVIPINSYIEKRYFRVKVDFPGETKYTDEFLVNGYRIVANNVKISITPNTAKKGEEGICVGTKITLTGTVGADQEFKALQLRYADSTTNLATAASAVLSSNNTAGAYNSPEYTTTTSATHTNGYKYGLQVTSDGCKSKVVDSLAVKVINLSNLGGLAALQTTDGTTAATATSNAVCPGTTLQLRTTGVWANAPRTWTFKYERIKDGVATALTYTYPVSGKDTLIEFTLPSDRPATALNDTIRITATEGPCTKIYDRIVWFKNCALNALSSDSACDYDNSDYKLYINLSSATAGETKLQDSTSGTGWQDYSEATLENDATASACFKIPANKFTSGEIHWFRAYNSQGGASPKAYIHVKPKPSTKPTVVPSQAYTIDTFCVGDKLTPLAKVSNSGAGYGPPTWIDVATGEKLVVQSQIWRQEGNSTVLINSVDKPYPFNDTYETYPESNGEKTLALTDSGTYWYESVTGYEKNGAFHGDATKKNCYDTVKIQVRRIIVNAIPTLTAATATAIKASLCQGDTIGIIGAASGLADVKDIEYKFYSNIGNDTVTHSFTGSRDKDTAYFTGVMADRTYYVTITAKNGGTCILAKQSAGVAITVNTTPVITNGTIAGDTINKCAGDAGSTLWSYTANATVGTLSYDLYKYDSATQTLSDKQTGVTVPAGNLTTASSGYYAIVATATSGSCVGSDTLITPYVKVSVTPAISAVTVTPWANTNICNDADSLLYIASITGSDIDSLTYIWSVDGKEIATKHTRAVKDSFYFNPASYSTGAKILALEVTAFGQNPDCKIKAFPSTKNITITIDETPKVTNGSIAGDTIKKCAGDAGGSVWSYTANTTVGTLSYDIYKYDSATQTLSDKVTGMATPAGTLTTASSGYYAIVATATSGTCVGSDTLITPYVKVSRKPTITTLSVSPWSATTVCANADSLLYVATAAVSNYDTLIYTWKVAGNTVAEKRKTTDKDSFYFNPALYGTGAKTLALTVTAPSENPACNANATPSGGESITITVNETPTVSSSASFANYESAPVDDTFAVCSITTGTSAVWTITEAAFSDGIITKQLYKYDKSAGTFTAVGSAGNQYPAGSSGSIAASDEGWYAYISTAATGSCSVSDTAYSAYLKVLASPVISSITIPNWANKTYCISDSAYNYIAAVAATDADSFFFEWKKDGSIIASEGKVQNADTFTFDPATASSTGSYTLDVTAYSNGGKCEDKLSASAVTLSVQPLPTITWDKKITVTADTGTSNTYICRGRNMSLSITNPIYSVTGNPDKIEWYKDGALVYTGNPYNPGNAAAALDGKYTAVVYKTNGSCTRTDTSDETTVTSYDFANAAATLQPAVDSVYLCNDGTGNITVTLKGGAGTDILTYKWFDKTPAVIAGETSSVLPITTALVPNVPAGGPATENPFTARLVLTNAVNGCKDSTEVTGVAWRMYCGAPTVSDSADGTPLNKATGAVACYNEMRTLKGTISNTAAEQTLNRGVTKAEWEYSSDGGTTFSALSSGMDEITVPATLPTTNVTVESYLTIANSSLSAGNTNYRFRLKVTRNDGKVEYSDTVTYYVNTQIPEPTAISVTPTADTVCHDLQTTYTASATKDARAAALNYIWYNKSDAVISSTAAYTATGDSASPDTSYYFKIVQREDITAPGARTCYDTAAGLTVTLHTNAPPVIVGFNGYTEADQFNQSSNTAQRICESGYGNYDTSQSKYNSGFVKTIRATVTSFTGNLTWYLYTDAGILDSAESVTTYSPSLSVSGLIPAWDGVKQFGVRTIKAVASSKGCPPASDSALLEVWSDGVPGVRISPDGRNTADTASICEGEDINFGFDVVDTAEFPIIAMKGGLYYKVTPADGDFKALAVGTGIRGTDGSLKYPTYHTYQKYIDTLMYVYYLNDNWYCKPEVSDTFYFRIRRGGFTPVVEAYGTPNFVTIWCGSDTVKLSIVSIGDNADVGKRYTYDSTRNFMRIRKNPDSEWIKISHSEFIANVDTTVIAPSVLRLNYKMMVPAGWDTLQYQLVDSSDCGAYESNIITYKIIKRAEASVPPFTTSDTTICPTEFPLVFTANIATPQAADYSYIFQFCKDSAFTGAVQSVSQNSNPARSVSSILPNSVDTVMYVRYIIDNYPAPQIYSKPVCKGDTSNRIRVSTYPKTALGSITQSAPGICESRTDTGVAFTASGAVGTIRWYLTANSGADTVARQEGTSSSFYVPLNVSGFIPASWHDDSISAIRNLTVAVKSGSCGEISKTAEVRVYRAPAKASIDLNLSGKDTVEICISDSANVDLTASLGSKSLYPITWYYESSDGSKGGPTSYDKYKSKYSFPADFNVTIAEGKTYMIYGTMTNGSCGGSTDSAWIKVINTSSLMTGRDLVILDVNGDTARANANICSNVMDMTTAPSLVFTGGGLPGGVTLDGYTYRFNGGTEQQGLPSPLQKGQYIFTAKLKFGNCNLTDKLLSVTIVDSVPKLDIAAAVPTRSAPSLSPGLNPDTLVFCGHDTMTISRANVPAVFAVKWYVSGKADMSGARTVNNSFKLDETWEPKYEHDTVYYAVAVTSSTLGNIHGCDSVFSDTLKIKVVAAKTVRFQLVPHHFSVCILDTVEIKFRSLRSVLDLDNVLLYLDTNMANKIEVHFSDMLNIPRSEWTISGDTATYKYFIKDFVSKTDVSYNPSSVLVANMAAVIGNGCYFDDLRGDNLLVGDRPKRYDTVVDATWIQILYPTVVKDPAFTSANSDTSLCTSGLPITINLNPLINGSKISGTTTTVNYAFDFTKDTNDPIAYLPSAPGSWSAATSYVVNFTPSISDTVRYLRYRAKDWHTEQGAGMFKGQPSKRCPDDTSHWIKIASYPRPVGEITNSADLDDTISCKGYNATLNLSWTSADTLLLFKNGVLDTAIATSSMNGTGTLEVTVNENARYTLMATNSKMSGTGTCSYSDTTNPSDMTMKVDLLIYDSTSAGSLTVNSKKNDEVTTPASLLLSVAGGNGTVSQLQYTHAVKPAAVDLSTFTDYTGYDGTVPPYSWTIQADVDQHSDTSYFRVFVKNGNCPGTYSDTVWVVVLEGARPISVITNDDKSGTYCAGTDIGLRLTHSKQDVMNKVDDDGVTWYAVNTATKDTSVIVSGLDGTDTAHYNSLPAGNYDLIAVYGFDGTQNSDTTAAVNVTITTPSAAGSLNISPNTVCTGAIGNDIWIKSNGTVGDIRNNLLFSKDSTVWSLRAAANDTNAVRKLERIMQDSGYYRIIVQSGTKCPADTSDPILFRVYPAISKGTITVNPNPAVYGDSVLLTLTGYAGIPDSWNIGGTEYPYSDSIWIYPVTDRDTAFVTVGNGSTLCDKDTAWAVILVYDSLVATAGPADPVIINGGTVDITVTPDNADLKYSDGTTPREDILGCGLSYQWYKGDPEGTNSILTGQTGATLTITYTDFKADTAATYYCVVKSLCDEDLVAITDTLSIREISNSTIFGVYTKAASGCYLTGTEANYYVVTMGDSVWVEWFLYNGSEIALASAGMSYQYSPAASRDTVIFANAGDLIGYDSIIVYAYDRQNKTIPFGRVTAGICVKTDIPVISLPESSNSPIPGRLEADTLCTYSGVFQLYIDTTNSGLKKDDYTVKGYVMVPGGSGTFDPIVSANQNVGSNMTVTAYQPGEVNSTGGFDMLMTGIDGSLDSLVFRLDVSYAFTTKPVDTSLYFVIRVAAPIASVEILEPDTVCVGSGVTLSGVVVSGGGINLPYTYYWKENTAGGNYSGADERETGKSTADTLKYLVSAVNPVSAWYLSAENRCTPAAVSSKKIITVHPDASKGTLAIIPNPVMYGDSVLLTLKDYSGTPGKWNIGGTEYPYSDSIWIYPVTDRDTAIVAVSSLSKLCKEDTAHGVILVYDSLVATIGPDDPIIFNGGTVTVTATPDNAGLTCSDGVTKREDILGCGVSYQWYKGTPDGTNSLLNLQTGANLNISYAEFRTDTAATYYCVVTSNCNEKIVAVTDTVSIREISNSIISEIHTKVSSDCYLAGNEATYYVIAAGDSVWVEWFLYDGSEVALGTTALSYHYSPAASRDTVIFANASDLTAYDSIIVYAYDRQNKTTPFGRVSKGICIRTTGIPVVSLPENIGSPHPGHREADTLCTYSGAFLLYVDTANTGLKTDDYAVKGYVMIPGSGAFTEVPPSGQTISSALTVNNVYQPGEGNSTGGFNMTMNGIDIALDSIVFRLDVSFAFTAKPVDTSLYFVIRVADTVASVTVLEPDTVCIGSGVTLNGVVVSGGGAKIPYTYYWKENTTGGDFSGADLRSTGTSTDDTLQYSVTAANPVSAWYLAAENKCGTTVVSPKVFIKVDSVPLLKGTDVIAVIGDSICSGSTGPVELYCTDSTGKYTFQWQYNNGTGWTDIIGATEPHYFISPAFYSDNGNYRVKITPSAESKCPATEVTSGAAYVYIDTVPLISDVFATSKDVTLRSYTSHSLNYPLLNTGNNLVYSGWYIKLNGESSFRDATTAVVADTLEINGTPSKTFDIVSAPLWLDSARVFATVRNDCGEMHSDTFNIYITDDLVIKDYDTSDMYVLCVSGGTAVIGVITNVKPEKTRWIVSANGGISYSDMVAPLDTVSFRDGKNGSFLTINNVAAAVGNRYAVIFNEGLSSEGLDPVYSDTLVFHIDDAVTFRCGNPLNITDTTVLTGECVTVGYNGCGFTPSETSDTFNLVYMGGISDTFNLKWLNPSKDTLKTDCFATAGTYTYRLGVYNHCGGDTVTAAVTVIETLITDTFIVEIPESSYDSIFIKDRGKPADDPANRSKITVCPSEAGEILMYVPDGKHIRTSWQWQVMPAGSTQWQNIDTFGTAYSYRNDTLVISIGASPPDVNPVNGSVYRLLSFSDVGSNRDTSVYMEIEILNTLLNSALLPDTVLCRGGEIDFRITPELPDYWTTVWYIDGDSVNANVTNHLCTAAIADSGKVVTVVCANICGTDTLRQVIKVQKPDTALLVITVDSVSCLNSEARFTANAAMVSGETPPAHTVTWYADGGVALGTGNPLSYAGLREGVHNVWAEVTFDGNSCISENTIISDTVRVEIVTPPSITGIGAVPDEITLGQTSEVYVVYSNGTLVWSDSNDVIDHRADTTATRPAESHDRPEWMFVATVTDSNGCTASDTVYIRVKTSLVLDSIFVDNIVTSIIPDEPDDTLATVIFRNDTAYVKICPDDKVILTLFCTGEDAPFSYSWYGLQPIERDDEAGRFTFFVSRQPNEWYCVITDTGGNSVTAYVIPEYKPTREIILTASPKMDLGKYYQSQRVQIDVYPALFDMYRFYQYENNVLVKHDSTKSPFYRTSFNYNEDRRNENVIFASVTDENHCRIAGKLDVGVLPLPNVMILNDVNREQNGKIFPNFRITVYNSWGIKIKDRNDGYGWDGTDRSGRQVESGTYFYYVEIKTDKSIETINGAVTVFKK